MDDGTWDSFGRWCMRDLWDKLIMWEVVYHCYTWMLSQSYWSVVVNIVVLRFQFYHLILLYLQDYYAQLDCDIIFLGFCTKVHVWHSGLSDKESQSYMTYRNSRLGEPHFVIHRKILFEGLSHIIVISKVWVCFWYVA